MRLASEVVKPPEIRQRARVAPDITCLAGSTFSLLEARPRLRQITLVDQRQSQAVENAYLKVGTEGSSSQPQSSLEPIDGASRWADVKPRRSGLPPGKSSKEWLVSSFPEHRGVLVGRDPGFHVALLSGLEYMGCFKAEVILLRRISQTEEVYCVATGSCKGCDDHGVDPRDLCNHADSFRCSTVRRVSNARSRLRSGE